MSKTRDDDKHDPVRYNFLAGSPMELFGSAARYALATPPKQLGRYTTPWDLHKLYPFEPSDILKAVSGIDGPQTRIALRNPAIVLSPGATGGFNLLLRHFMSVYNDYQTMAEDIRHPVLLTTSPTYGAFFELGRMHGFDMHGISLGDSDSKFRLTPEALETKLDELHEDPNRFVVAFIDTSPHNPTGRIRSRQHTEELACVLVNYKERRGAMLAQSAVHNMEQFSMAYDKIRELVDLPIIDDLAYFGLEHYETQTHSFIAVPGVAQHTHVLLSASKLGLPALRTGMVLTNELMANELIHLSYRSYDAPTVPVARAAQAVWSMHEPFRTQRDKHLQRQRLNYRRNAQLVEALFNGLDNTAIDPADKAWINTQMKKYLGHLDVETIKALKQNGIPSIKVKTKNQKAGFFHILSFDQDIWMPIIHKLMPREGFSDTEEERMNRLLDKWKITLLPSSWMGVNSNSSVYRMSFARPVKDIFALAAQLITMAADSAEEARTATARPILLPEGFTLVERPLPNGARTVETVKLNPEQWLTGIRVLTAD